MGNSLQGNRESGLFFDYWVRVLRLRLKKRGYKGYFDRICTEKS